MTTSWPLKDARQHLDSVIEQTNNGPQIITVQGKEAAVLLSIAEYRRLEPVQPKLSAFFRDSPLCDTEIDLKRDSSLPRNIELDD